MGRLLRKKPAFRPKNKSDGGENIEPGQAEEASSGKAGKIGTAPDAAAAEKKRRAVMAARPAPAAKAYPGRRQVDKVSQFLREVRVELRKVTWPSRKQTVGSTAVVIVLVVIISLFLGAVDVLLSNLVRMVLQ
jgi:preprotein translocase subunit SecE